MRQLFCRNRILPHSGLQQLQSRGISMCTKQFKLTEQASESSPEKTYGQLVKINASNKDTSIESVLEVLQTTIIRKK